jgi:hypothetical protein
VADSVPGSPHLITYQADTHITSASGTLLKSTTAHVCCGQEATPTLMHAWFLWAMSTPAATQALSLVERASGMIAQPSRSRAANAARQTGQPPRAIKRALPLLPSAAGCCLAGDIMQSTFRLNAPKVRLLSAAGSQCSARHVAVYACATASGCLALRHLLSSIMYQRPATEPVGPHFCFSVP